MAKFDKEIKKMSREFQVPETYHKKVDEILERIQEDHVAAPRKKLFVKVVMAMTVLCLFITGGLGFFHVEEAEAGILETFKHTIMDFFGLGEEESEKIGVESEKKEAVSKPDLMIELQEVVMDMQNIYAVVKITAPPSVAFKEGMTFDYFGFCEGANYNASAVVPGSRECVLLETMENRDNVATFVVNAATDEQIEEEKDMTIFFEDLISGPYEDEPEVLVEGIWSLSFTTSYTNTKDITIEGTEDMKYSFADTTADIEKIVLRPLGLTLVSDVSKVDTDTLYTTDTRFTIRLAMIDGSEIIVESPDPEDGCLVNGGSIGIYDQDGHHYQKYVGQFRHAVDVSQVLGIHIADYYVPFKEYE